MSIFFSFITTTIVESQRQGESPNVVVRYPAAPWLLVNIVSGAIVTPLVMAPGYFHHPRRCLCKQQQSRMASPDSLPNRAVHASAKLAIPLSVTGRFIIPLMTLIFASSPTTVMLWQFFPIYVAILFRLLSTILSQLPPTLSAASQGRSKELLFTIPILLSILSYAGPIIYTFPLLLSQHHAEASHLTTPAVHILAINFLTIFITLIYRLYVEGGTLTARAAPKWTLVAGPGAGMCFGWITREEAMRTQIMMDSRIEREKCDELRPERVDGARDPVRMRSRPDVHKTSKAITYDDEESILKIQPLLAHT
jgi:hypothetical protein